ncbi:MAG: biotin--[acetyl-CoA-carboxylase] ligase [Nitrospiraceae bacterium]
MNSAAAAFQPLTSRIIKTALSTKVLGRMLHVLDETPSTNSLAADLAQQGAPHGTVVVAEAQSAGRGRLGRRWHSPHGKNLYCSIILRPLSPPDQLPSLLSWIPLISAIAAARTIQAIAALRPSLKWPNDVLIGSRKIAGLLCESSGAGTATPFIVVGVGLNVNTRADTFPEEIRNLATSLVIETGRPFDRTAVLATLLSELEIRYDMLVAGGLPDLIDEYRMRCSTIGQRVRVSLAGEETVEGLAESINPDGSLRIKPERPQDRSQGRSWLDVRAGDVVHLRRSQP